MDWRQLDERIDGLSAEKSRLFSANAGCDRLMSIPGLGPIIASATVAAIGAGGRARPTSPIVLARWCRPPCWHTM
jgi:transposase